jgi:2-polyprenyl-6-methoxyphenol hydroxylase-like FAD-dependent oxidoreductase
VGGDRIVTAPRILIVGGGLAGLSLACALRGSRFDIEHVEQRATWPPSGAGIAMQPNAMRALRQLGVGDAVTCAGHRITRWVFRDRAGQALCDIDVESVGGDVGSFIGISRTALHAALRAAAPGCRLGSGLRALRDDGGHCVTVSFSDGRSASYDLVVGADGIGSTVRRSVFGGPQPIYGGQMVWRSIADTGPGGSSQLQFWLGDGCFFGLCPIDDTRTYGFANVTGPRHRDSAAGRLDRLRRRFETFGPAVQEHLAALRADQQVHCTPIEWLPLGEWRRGRVILVGDAAHASSPMMGQGGSMAIEDAVVLAAALSVNDDVDQALDTFVAQRAERVAWVHQQSQAIGALIDRPPAIRDELVRQYGAQAFADRYRPLTAPLLP